MSYPYSDTDQFRPIGFCDTPPDFAVSLAPEVTYGIETGELHVIDQLTSDVLDIRKGVVEEATRQAVIVELERLGYVVLGPYL